MRRVPAESRVERERGRLREKGKREQAEQQTAHAHAHAQPITAARKVKKQKQRRRKGGYASASLDGGPEDVSDPDTTSPSVVTPSASAALTSPELTSALQGRNAWVSLAIISFCWFTSVSLWVIALPYTSAARASLFSSLYPLFVILYLRLWRKIPVSMGEFTGVAVCVFGIALAEILATLNPDTHTIMAQTKAKQAEAEEQAQKAAAALAVAAGALNTTSAALTNGTALISSALMAAASHGASPAVFQMFGDALCVVGSIFIGYNVVEGSPCRTAVPLFAYTAVTSIGNWILLLLGTLIFENSTIDAHPVTGVFGWTASGEMLLRICLFGFVVGMIGILGFNYAISRMSPIVFSTVQLLDPGLAGLMSAVFGVEVSSSVQCDSIADAGRVCGASLAGDRRLFSHS